MKLKRTITTLVIISTFFSLMYLPVMAIGTKQKIDVLIDGYALTVNEKKLAAGNILYNGKLYVPIRDIAAALGALVSTNDKTKTVAVSRPISDQASTFMQLPAQTGVDAYNAIISLDPYLINEQNITGISVDCDGKLVPMNFSFANGNVKISSFDNQSLLLNKSYKLKIFMKDGTWYSKDFKTAGLPDITDNGKFRVIKVPAMPEKGFNYPYYLTLPSSDFKQDNIGKERYLLVEPNNGGYVSDDLKRHDKDAFELADKYNSRSIGERLWLPRLIPCFPRPESLVNEQPIYTHSLSRNTIMLENLMDASGNDEKFFKDMIRVDKQLNAMMDHAIQYLNQYGYNVDSKKVFMWGYSASGDFVNRFTALYPERVKAAMSGGHSNRMLLPLSEAGGFKLIYPLGTYDYEKITGKKFSLEAYNNVAQYIYEGELDDNDTYNKWDCFGEQENKIIRELLGEQKYPQRWNKTKELFFKAGGKAQFVIYKGAKHETFSNGMDQDYYNFFNANRSSTKPVYIKVSRPELTIQ